MSIRKLFRRKNSLLFSGFLLGISLTLLSFIVYLLLPALTSSDYYQKSLKPLRKQARAIKHEFGHILASIRQKQNFVSSHEFPSRKDEIYALIKRLSLRANTEGAAYYDENRNLSLWKGNSIDLDTILDEPERENLFQNQGNSFLVKDKASVYLISPQRVSGGGFVVLYRLLAFQPPLKTRYLKEYQFLKPKLIKNLQNIRYYDSKEDISAFERLFSKHEDEYLGQPSLQNEIQTIFFPLRNENGQIIALVNLSSPSRSSSVSARKESTFLIFHLLFGASLLVLLIHLSKTSALANKHRPVHLLLIIITLVGLRYILLSLSGLENIKSLSIFSPSLASFLPFTSLAKSPADIFLTSLFLFLIILSAILFLSQYFRGKAARLSLPLSLLLNGVMIALSLFLFTVFQRLIEALIFNSNLNLLRFALSFSSILLHLSVLFFSCSFFLILFAVLRIVFRFTPHILYSVIILLPEAAVFFLLFKTRHSYLISFTQVVVILALLSFAFFPTVLQRKRIIVLSIILSSLFLYLSLDYYSAAKSRFHVQNSLKNTITSQENWANFVADQTVAELENFNESIVSFFSKPTVPDFARSLWRETLASKFNWYSSLEVWDREGELLSRFSLNVPQLYPSDFTLSFSREWLTAYQSIPFMGQGKNLLVSFKDWFDNGDYLGRLMLTFSVDYDMLPFLYSANPYFELIRVTTLPSLNQFNFGFAVYDLEGKLIFNPNKISQGIPPDVFERVAASNDTVWSAFQDKNKKYLTLYFRTENRIYSFFVPQKNFINFSVEYLRLLFLYTALFLLPFLVVSITLRKRKIRNPFWSFSNKVYASFISIAIIPLLFFTFFTRNFFEQIFSQQFIEKAEVHANFAYRIMEDYLVMQEEERLTPIAPPDDLVLWISSTISNDVNLYQNGRLISSSRREFYDSGLLPELIDGEIFYKIQFENNPFYTQHQKIGELGFHTLTIPFTYLDSLFLISLPFPFEKQEVSNATEEFIEFLVFISIFFVGLVLVFARGMGAMIITPIKKLLRGTREVGLGNLKVSIEHKPHDEMKTLIEGFNAMIKNLRKHQQELTDLSKKVAWAEMARKVAHEIKNPLTPIQLSAEHLLKVHSDKRGDFDQTLRESASYIIKEVEHLRKIAQDFLELSREKALQKEPFDVKELIRETVSPFKKTLSERIAIQEKYEEGDFEYEGDQAKIRVALRNILINAIEAIRNYGEIEVKLSRTQGYFTIEINDTGIGMEKEMLVKIFEPSFSTKDVGTGLGLPITRKIIEDHGGTIKISSELGKGTKIIIQLPFFIKGSTPDDSSGSRGKM